MAEGRRIVHSEKVQAGSRTYFFDVRQARNRTHYLEINEARIVDEGKRERSRLTLFPEHIKNFQAALERSVEAVRQPFEDKE